MIKRRIYTPVSRFINGHTVAYVLYGIFMAGIFEECGRYVIIKYIMKKNKTMENMIMYGIGHGGIEVWTVSLATIVSYLSMAIMLNQFGLETFMVNTGVTEQTQASALATMNQVVAAWMVEVWLALCCVGLVLWCKKIYSNQIKDCA